MKKLTKEEKDILLKAAQELEEFEGGFSCLAINYISNKGKSPFETTWWRDNSLCRKYMRLYVSEKEVQCIDEAFDVFGEGMENSDHRILCLLFAREILS